MSKLIIGFHPGCIYFPFEKYRKYLGIFIANFVANFIKRFSDKKKCLRDARSNSKYCRRSRKEESWQIRISKLIIGFDSDYIYFFYGKYPGIFVAANFVKRFSIDMRQLSEVARL